MKKIALAVCVTLGMSLFCFAQQPSEPVNETVANPADIKILVGRVASVHIDDPLKNFPGIIEIIDEGGQRLVVVTVEKTTMSDNKGIKINLRQLKNNDKVTIHYIVDHKNHKLAESIKVTE